MARNINSRLENLRTRRRGLDRLTRLAEDARYDVLAKSIQDEPWQKKIPDDDFEREWAVAGEKLRSILRSGSDVVVHCRGGLGRAGTIAARLLIELGSEPETAMASVRAVRPGAIENDEQEMYVLGLSTAQK